MLADEPAFASSKASSKDGSKDSSNTQAVRGMLADEPALCMV
jgi:hypothetical protein